MKKPTVTPNMIDKAVMFVAPQWGMSRIQSRMKYEALSMGGYIGADTSRRSMRSANTTIGSSDTDDLPSLEKLRAIARDMYRNAPIVHGAGDTIRFNVIGSGLTVQSDIDREFLGMDEEAARKWEQNAERLFRFWADSESSDAERTSNFYELQTIALMGALISGDIFAALPYVKREGTPFSLIVQLIEADRCSNPNSSMDTDKIAGGVEVDALGAPTHYHFTKYHPGGLRLSNEWKRIPAFGNSGRRNILHVYEKLRPGQKRGVSILAPIIEPLKQFTDYTHAELTAAVVSGLFTVFIESESGGVNLDMEDENGGSGSNVDADELNLSAGAILGLAPGEKVTTANPNRPNTAFDPFTQAILKQIGAALNIPFEVLMKHFSASYSASRAALLEAWKMFRSRRTWFSKKFCQPIYEAVLTEAVLIGRLDAPGFLEDPMVRRAYCQASWKGPAQGQLNPVNETKAADMRVESGYSTRAAEAAEMNGSDFDQNIKRATVETRQMKESGLFEMKYTTASIEQAKIDQGNEQ
ncbi:phage portal protein [Sulfuricurvum sp. IAE1]|uniref:phage portal protein n=1 Tax=Sulfuricurvum sp. IAE1 TaxID=2546102 RepID=UPI00140545A7|nr:phage portal protein [Sulfuricurvum sp. IAE1]